MKVFRCLLISDEIFWAYGVESLQAVEKRPSAAFPSFWRTSKYASLRRISGAPVNGISKTQLASACLREAPPCGAKAGAFLISLKKRSFSTWFLGDLIQRPRFALPIKIKPFLSFSLLSLLKYLQYLFLPFSCVTKVANSCVGGRKSV